ncbi:LexA family transcriptional regulator [Acetobacter pasteurianus]|uniref:LexA family transcriptional regulator n=1 Tax=Acetobacter pasteurianus TaxID=438 RepID=UPI000F55B4A2|nr:helix-turn-helix domain-containing protein [Acetobacter pasteurianus]GCD55183.1 transcriptional regulator [Acetobacter pasteurianus NBRC 3222]
MTRSPVADELERRMAHLGLSQKALARKAGVGDTYVRDILKGKSRNPGGEKLECIAAVLGCTARDLLFPGVDHAQPGLMLRERRTPYLPPPFTPQETPRDTLRVHGFSSREKPENAPQLALDMAQIKRTRSTPQPRPAMPAVAAPPGYVMVPYLAQRSITSGRYDEAQLLGSPKYFEESLITQRLNARAEDLRALNVEGQAMEPLLRDGDLVLMDTQRTTLAEPGLFVLFDGESVVCRWAERTFDAQTRPVVQISCENKRFSACTLPASRVQILGRVVWYAHCV